MERRSSLNRSVVAGIVVLLAVVMSACSGRGPVGAPPAASVGDVHISVDQVTSYIKDQQAINDVLNPAGPDAFRDKGRLDMSTASGALSQLVRMEILEQVLADADGKVTDADRDKARTALDASLASSGIDKAKLPNGAYEDSVNQAAVSMAIERVLVDRKEVEARYNQVKDQFRNICVQATVADSQAGALDARQRLLAGEDFAKVFAETNTVADIDATKGDLGCHSANDFQQLLGQSVFTAEINSVTEPAPLEEGQWIIGQVTKFEPAGDDVVDQVKKQISEDLLAPLVQKILRSTVEKVQINNKFGHWDATQMAVVAPVDPTATTSGQSAVAIGN